MSGRFHLAIDGQHKKYGDVFRVSPNELSFASVASWKAIYGHPIPASKPTLIKSEFYEMYGAGFKSLCIGSERDPTKHGAMRKHLSAAFSTRALTEQESIVARVLDEFIERISWEEKFGEKGKGINVTKWYEMVSFDVLGEMAFGQTFGCVRSGEFNTSPIGHLVRAALSDFPPIDRARLTSFTRRLNSKIRRKDFMSTLVEKVENGELEKEEMTAHASTLVIAGGETVSTFLGAVTYYLTKRPDCLRKLQEEIRMRYGRYDEINATTAQQLPYLQAVINEGLRIYPPGSQGFPRVSPGTVIADHWVPKGAEVYTSAWTLTHDERNFRDPFSFKPERWLDHNNTDVKEASQPFSLGPRGCLGRNFAYMEMNLVLAKMLWRYDLQNMSEGLDWEGESHMHVMWWKPELRIRFHERIHEAGTKNG
ncbi:MAG: hypothetical protein Q9218_002835 [Villophora microphyllina]